MLVKWCRLSGQFLSPPWVTKTSLLFWLVPIVHSRLLLYVIIRSCSYLGFRWWHSRCLLVLHCLFMYRECWLYLEGLVFGWQHVPCLFVFSCWVVSCRWWTEECVDDFPMMIFGWRCVICVTIVFPTAGMSLPYSCVSRLPFHTCSPYRPCVTGGRENSSLLNFGEELRSATN